MKIIANIDMTSDGEPAFDVQLEGDDPANLEIQLKIVWPNGTVQGLYSETCRNLRSGEVQCDQQQCWIGKLLFNGFILQFK
jgi:hypothetical protein